MTRTKKTVLAAAAGAGLLVVAACGSSGGSGGGGNATAQQPGSSTAAGTASVTVQQTGLGKVLADAGGHTLYLLTANGADVKCTGGCLTIWQPLLLPAGTTTPRGSGVTGQVAVVSQGSAKQITVSGHPLYTYTADAGARQTSGQGVQSFGGTWYVVGPSGSAITTSGGAGPSPSDNGYGY